MWSALPNSNCNLDQSCFIPPISGAASYPFSYDENSQLVGNLCGCQIILLLWLNVIFSLLMSTNLKSRVRPLLQKPCTISCCGLWETLMGIFLSFPFQSVSDLLGRGEQPSSSLVCQQSERNPPRVVWVETANMTRYSCKVVCLFFFLNEKSFSSFPQTCNWMFWKQNKLHLELMTMSPKTLYATCQYVYMMVV